MHIVANIGCTSHALPRFFILSLGVMVIEYLMTVD